MSTNSTTESGSSSFPTISLGNGLVELTALTTLVGSSITESFVLGNHGSVGLAWAPMSSFGIISVIKGCISGASPGWLRQTLGLRTTASDTAVGLDIGMQLRGRSIAQLVKGTPHNTPVGICRTNTKKKYSPFAGDISSREVYIFDSTTSNILGEVPSSQRHEPFEVYTYAEYPFSRHINHDTRLHLVALFLSTFKGAEVYYMWSFIGPIPGACSLIPWAYFFIFAIAIELQEIILSRTPSRTGGYFDVIAGQLPSVKKPGGSKKIFLGGMDDPRRYNYWRFAWLLGAILCTFSTIMTYFILSQQSTTNVLTWTAFQALWFVLRIIIYHFSSPANPMAHRAITKQPWIDLSDDMKERVLHLVLGVAAYQVPEHPRESHGDAYGEDCLSVSTLQHLLLSYIPSRQSDTPFSTFYRLPSNISKGKVLNERIRALNVDIEVCGVIGDTVLSSMVWMEGMKLTPMDVYDCCVVIMIGHANDLSSSNKSQNIAVPAIRVLSCIPNPTEIDHEQTVGQPLFVPRGASSQVGDTRTWHYWLPCCEETSVMDTSSANGTSTPKMWLHVQSDNLRILGKRRAALLSEVQLDGMLAAGRLNIGLKGIRDVEETLEISRGVARTLQRWLNNKV